MNLTCFVVDDYLANAEKIVEYAKNAGLVVLGLETDAISALQQIKAMVIKPDLIFLDISMPGMNGLEMAEQLKDIAIIFTTAHRHYAPESYRLDALYYLLKPIAYDDFLESIKKAVPYIAAHKGGQRNAQEFIKIQGSGKGSIIRIRTEEIIYLKSAQHYIDIYTTTKQYVVHRSMKTLLTELGGLPFLRVHKSFAVNMEKVIELKDGTIHLTGGYRAELGSGYKEDFLKWL